MLLNFKKFGEGEPLIILHGLLGSLDNWQSIAKAIADNGNYTVYIVDQRNHGRSPHSEEFDYNLLSDDLLEWMKQNQIPAAHLIGHSMGGKTAMQFALNHPLLVKKLIVVDITPDAFNDRHSDVFKALMEADLKNASTRDQVQEFLRKKLEDETTVQFLLKSLVRSESPEDGFMWRFNVESLFRNYGNVSSAIESPHPFTGKTLFVKGSRSNYINSSNYHSVVALFPNHELEEIRDAGHWVHADQPKVFTETAINFLKQ